MLLLLCVMVEFGGLCLDCLIKFFDIGFIVVVRCEVVC